MYLKRVELQGFKSFADKSVIEFKQGINGIVGPNGCGKSNITDAIRWVLGEKSAKAMRGDAMTDVIFSGSEDRKPQNLAEVTLVFDNEDHHLEYDANEVEITRRLYRIDKEAEYFINRQPCRLKDITDLIMDSGLGKGSLSIISQNSISAFVSSKPEERRVLFEEAAGVAKYKKRKRESVNKLERTTHNLERAEDIVNELEKQIGPLRRQKEKAERYLSFKEELQDIEVSVLVKMIKDHSFTLKKLNASLDELTQMQATKESGMVVRDHQSEEISKKMYALDQEINTLQGKLLVAMNNVTNLETQKVEIDANRKHLLESDNQKHLEEKIDSLKAILQDVISEYNDRVARLNVLKEEKDALTKRQADNGKKKDQLRKSIEDMNIALHQSRATRERLKDEIENHSRYSQGVRAILKAKASLSGIRGTIGDLCESEPGYETALSVSLGGAHQFIITDEEDDAKKAISFLRHNKAGRATFMPKKTMKPRSLRDHKMVVEAMPGYLGVMSDFVNYPSDIENVILNQLGHNIVADSLDHATMIAKDIHHRYKVVTCEGDVINVGGSLTGGSLHKAHSPFIAKRELEKIEEKIKNEEHSLNEKRILLHESEDLGRELSQALMQKQMSYAKLELVATNKKNELGLRKSEYEALTHESVELEDLSSGSTSSKLIDELNEAKRLRDKLKEDIATKREIRMGYVNDKEAIDSLLKQLRSELKDLEHELTNQKIKKTKLESEIENYLMRLNDEYKMTYEHAQSISREDLEIDSAKDRVRDLRQRIASLGNVNVEAIEQYNEVSSRYEELNNNRLELIKAQDSLLKAIDDMDHIMIEKFTSTFEAINVQFNEVFRYLFGGGHASLHYSDPSNILETGIEIEAQPPGKSAKLHSFSGGENALIALSCLFAIISVRPVPLCILDEVEAALDIANVERFAKYLRQFSDKTQFVVVTHREGTMAECDLLYGATMQQKGVTKLVSVQLKEAVGTNG
jgi:chromosome segregation protein